MSTVKSFEELQFPSCPILLKDLTEDQQKNL